MRREDERTIDTQVRPMVRVSIQFSPWSQEDVPHDAVNWQRLPLKPGAQIQLYNGCRFKHVPPLLQGTGGNGREV